MATMVKEKSRAKKKKEKHVSKSEFPTEVLPVTDLSTVTENETALVEATFKGALEDGSVPSSSTQLHISETDLFQNETSSEVSQCSTSLNQLICQSNQTEELVDKEKSVSVYKDSTVQSQVAYADVCKRLDIVTFKDIPADCDEPIEILESRIETSTSYLNQSNESARTDSDTVSVNVDRVENTIPTAPTFEEPLVLEAPVEAQEELREIEPRVQCMPIEVAMQLFGGKEMAEVQEMSEREEALVEAGALPGPEHPLVDLLSTFRCSLTARELVSHKIAQGFAAADKERVALWKIEKKTITASEQCHCGATVSFKGTYDHAELMKTKLPAAQLRLEGLLKEVQESACHYQHAALLAYFQIEELISETLQSGKREIRAALSLVMHELRVCGRAPALFCGALRRWARALAGALLDARDPRQLLFLLHLLFRQSRSVRWAAPLLRAAAGGAEAARTLALLARLLAGPALEAARECTEENEEIWEEVGARGGSGAVGSGALRERDLLALLRAFPLRALAARTVLLTRADITQTRPYEWDHPARDVLRALCGVRALLAVARRAARAHAGYARLRAALAALAHAALHAAAALHQHNRASYPKEMEGQIEAELEALFAEGCEMGGGRPPASLLRPPTRAAYCVALITHLHEPSVVVEPLALQLRPGGCACAVRDVTRAAVDADDAELARLVLDFLVQTALKRSNASCDGACAGAARECLPRLLRAHAGLHTAALRVVADLHMLEPVGSSVSLDFLALSRWRPAPSEVLAVLEDWARRCPSLLPRLLLGLRYTPYDGLSLESQLAVGAWLCAAPAPEWAWDVLTRLRVHRSSWGLPLEAPPPGDTSSLFAEAYAVLSSSWGHSVPEICEYGVRALRRVAAARAAAAAHALPLLMAAMAASPESVALTPQFSELVVTLLTPAQSLVQWARGERGAAPELLLRRMLAQIEARPATAAAWLRALLRPALAGAPLAAADAALLAALLAARRVPAAQEAPEPELLTHLVRNAAHAPLACEAALVAAHARELSAPLFVPLVRALDAQRASGQKIHVDNALKQIGSSAGSEELVVYRAAAAALAAAPAQPAHLALWRLLLHLYLHAAAPDSPPVGVAFFSGLIKSRTLAQLKKRLQETIAYHHSQVESFKTSLRTNTEPKPTTSQEKSKSKSPENILTAATIAEVTGESSDSSDSEEFEGSEGDDESSSDVEEDKSESDAEEKRRINVNMLTYHESAERMLSEYLGWLEAGERLRAAPHRADVARFIPQPALNTAWRQQLSRMRPARAAGDDDVRLPRAPPAPAPPRAPLPAAVRRLLRLPAPAHRSRVPVITSPVDNVDFGNQRQLFDLVDRHLGDLEQFSKEWSADVERVSALDKALWPLVGALRVRAPLAPVVRCCANKCAPVVLSMQGSYEWRISEAAANSIKDNRSRARAAAAGLARARPRGARTAASLHTIARRVRSTEAALGVAERAWRCAGAAPPCAPALDALLALVDTLADRWLQAEAAAPLAARWCGAGAPAQQALCGALLARAAAPLPRLYAALLAAAPPDPSRAFCYLSKFDMSAAPSGEAARGEMLRALAAAAERGGRDPPPDALPLFELIGVHTAALLTAPLLSATVLRAARAAAAGRAPAAYLAHVARAAAAAAEGVPFDELGNLLRELGATWWAGRAAPAQPLAAYAPHVAELLAALLRAFVAAARALSYAPQRVGWYLWGAAQESWGAWVAPRALPPLAARAAPRRFVAALVRAAAACPGCEEQLLSQAFEWTVQVHANLGASDAERVQMADLLEALAELPWAAHQWADAGCLPAALQISSSSDEQMRAWAAAALRGAAAGAWLRGAGAGDAAPRLAALLQLAAGALPLHAETLEAMAAQPWERLPAPALEQALLRFFEEHLNPLLPYHDAPQFRVFLAASGLSPFMGGARERRAVAVSLWARAAAAPQLSAHAAAHARAILDVLTALEPRVEEEGGELEELLQRAAAVLCVEPAAAAALPVWRAWARGAPARRARAALAAARALPALDSFAPLADAAAAALLAAGGSWSCARARLAGSARATPGALLARGCAHAAYALALAAPAPPEELLHERHNFAEEEVMTSVWICATGRCARAGCARAGELLRAWAAPPRLALLRALLPGAAPPTARHRLLCQLALCIITPDSESLARAFEAACAGAAPAAHAWARAPRPKHLPMLAALLHPGHDNYFVEEMKLAGAL